MITFNEFAAKRNRINELVGGPVESPATTQAPQQPVFGIANRDNLRGGIKPLIDKFVGKADNYGNRNQQVETALTFIEDILDTNIQQKGEAGQQENNQIITRLDTILSKYRKINNAYNVPQAS